MAQPLDPESEIEITYGGGLQYISEFLSGQASGYDRYDKGCIYVSPHVNGRNVQAREPGYAITGYRFFDTPAILKAKIKVKDLRAAMRDYEALLHHKNVSELKDIEVTPCRVKHPYWLKEEYIRKACGDDEKLCSRVSSLLR